MSDAPPDPRHARLAWGIVIVLGLQFLTGPLLRPLLRPYVYSDFATFYDAARCFATHRDPYDADSLRSAGDGSFNGWVGRYFYPPPFAAVAVRPFALLPFAASRRVWVVFEAAAYVLALVLLAGEFVAWSWPWRGAAAAALGLVFAPIALDLKLGSVSGLLLFLLALFERELRRGRATRAGLALAAAVLLKLTPALLVVFLALRGERRVVLRTLAGGAAIVLVCLPWTGLQAYVVYATRVVPLLLRASFAWFTNQSIDAFFWRILVPNPDTTPWIANPALQRAATWSIDAVLLGGLLWLVRRLRRSPRRADTEAWGRALVLAVSLLVARVTWEYMLVLALPCLFHWLAALARGEVGWRIGAAVAVAYALCALPFPYTEAPIRSGIGLLYESPRTYGLLVLCACTFYHLRRPGPPLPIAA